jgi:hypothetical protein
VDRYEQLRERALAGDASGWRCGLAILQHRGMVAWLHAWQTISTSEPTEPPTRATTSCPQPMPGVTERLVEALASMALAVAAGR